MDVLQNWRAYLPAKERLYEPLALFLIALLLVGTLALVLLSLLPNARERGALQTQLTNMVQAVALEQTVQAEAPARVAGQINQAETQVAVAADGLLSEAEANGALNQLYQHARVSGVTIVDLKAQSTPNVTPDAIVRVLRFRLQVEGTLPRLLNFLARIEETERAGFALNNVTIQAEGESHTAAMDLALHISPYAQAAGAAGVPPTPIPPLETLMVTPTATLLPAVTPSPSQPGIPQPPLPTVPLVSPALFPIQAGCPNLINNGDFEAIGGWLFGPSATPPRYTSSQRQAGLQAMQLGVLPGTGTLGRSSYSSIRQLVTIPITANRTILYWWQWAGTEETATVTLDPQGDRQEILLLTPDERVLAAVQQQRQNENGWQLYAADLTNYRGQSFYLHVNVFNNGNAFPTWLYLDGVVLQSCDPTAPPTATATSWFPTATPLQATATPLYPTATALPGTALPGTALPGTATPTAVPGCVTLVSNGGFEAFGSWILGQSNAPPQYVTTQAQTGVRAMQLGRLPGGGSAGRSSYSSVRQSVTIPATAQRAILRWWQWTGSEEPPTATPGTAGDRQETLLLTPDERVVAVLQRARSNSGGWQELRADLTAYRGQSLYLYWNVFNDSNNQATWLYLDDVALLLDCVVPPVSTMTPTPTATPIQGSILPTLTPTATPTGVAGCVDLLHNGDFEVDSSWEIGSTASEAMYTSDQRHTGNRAIQLGILPAAQETRTWSSIRQTVTLPADATILTLRWWQWTGTEESTVSNPSTTDDLQEVLLLTPDKRVLTVIQRTRQTSGGWEERSADLSAYRGRTVSLYMNVYNDGGGGRTWMYVDSVSLSSCASPPIVQASVPTASTSGLGYPKCAENPVASTARNTPIRIVAIDKEAESVTLQNVSVSFPVDVTGWHMCSITGDQEHDGIAGIIAPGAMASFNYSGSGSIWSNSEQDDGALYDVDGNLISYWID